MSAAAYTYSAQGIQCDSCGVIAYGEELLAAHLVARELGWWLGLAQRPQCSLDFCERCRIGRRL